MGKNKLLLRYKNKSFLSHSYNNINKTRGFFQILYVFPKVIEKELLTQIKKLQINYVSNPEKKGIIYFIYSLLDINNFKKQGKDSIMPKRYSSMSMSIYYALIKLPSKTDLVAIFLGDMPKLDEKNIIAFIKKALLYKQDHQYAKIFQPYNTKNSAKLGHPLIIDYKLAIKIFNYRSCLSQGLPKKIINKYLKNKPNHKISVKMNSDNFFTDIDTLADYNKLTNGND